MPTLDKLFWSLEIDAYFITYESIHSLRGAHHNLDWVTPTERCLPEMGSWHDCDSRCARLHSALVAKFTSVIMEARSVSGRTAPCKDETFHLPTATFPPSVADGPDGWRQPLELTIILDGRPEAGPVMFLETSRDNGSMQRVPTEVTKQGVVLETWRIHFDNTGSFVETPGTTTLDEFVVNAIMVLRSIYSLTRTLPAFRLLGRPGLPMGVTRGGVNRMLGLDQSILGEGGAFEPTSQIRLVPLKSPHGVFHVDIRYRRNCSFVLSEAPVSKTINRGTSFESVNLGVPLEQGAPIKTPSSSSSLLKPAVPLLSNSMRQSSDSLLPWRPSIIRRSSSPSQPFSLSASSVHSPSTLSRRSGSLSSRTGTSLKEDSELLAFFEWIQRPIPTDLGDATFRDGLLTNGEEIAQTRDAILEECRRGAGTRSLGLSPIPDTDNEDSRDASDSVLFEISMHD